MAFRGLFRRIWPISAKRQFGTTARKPGDKNVRNNRNRVENDLDVQDGYVQRSSSLGVAKPLWTNEIEANRQALAWHKDCVQVDHLSGDALVSVTPESSNQYREHRWSTWEAEWDEGWDWEDKWHPDPANPLESRDDPRRPKGPLVPWTDGGYKSVIHMNSSEVVKALVAARQDAPGEVVWQALCQRAERVAIAFTPAEVLAVVRIVSERQAGQLRLLWKLAGLVVEKLPAFTAEDLVLLATSYSSLDTMHHGLLNVTALVLAGNEDLDIVLTPQLSVRMLAAFAKAKYPLPLLVGKSKRVLFGDPGGLKHEDVQLDLSGVSQLTPSEAIETLKSLTILGALDRVSVSALLFAALIPHQLTRLAKNVQDSQPDFGRTRATAAPISIATVGASCNWVLLAQGQGLLADLTDTCAVSEIHWPAINGYLSGDEAIRLTRQVAQDVFRRHDLRRLRVVRSASNIQCVVPFSANASITARKGATAASIEASLMLSAAQLFASPTSNDDASSLAAALLEGAMKPSSSELWPIDMQVGWLKVAVHLWGTTLSSVASTRSLLQVLSGHDAFQLIPHMPDIFQSLPKLCGTGTAEDIASLGCALAETACDQHFRFTLSQASSTTRGCMELVDRLREDSGDVGVEASRRVKNYASRLLSAAAENLPAKCRAERAFGRSRHEGIDEWDVVSWCQLLADHKLIESCGGAPDSFEALWQHLAEEAASVIRRGDPDKAALALLRAFTQESRRKGWRAIPQSSSNSVSPLFTVADAISFVWARALAIDGEELEEPEHEPAQISKEVEQGLLDIFREIDLAPPARQGQLPPGPAALRRVSRRSADNQQFISGTTA